MDLSKQRHQHSLKSYLEPGTYKHKLYDSLTTVGVAHIITATLLAPL